MSRGTRAAWSAARTALDECPWPGPRPLGVDDDALLCGRDTELKDFVGVVSLKKLVILHGQSGVGKSSLLSSGLIPHLGKSGFIVAACNDWSGGSSETLAPDFMAARIRDTLSRQFPESGLGDIPQEGFFAELDEKAGSRTVLILDQFEELLREDDQEFVEGLFELIVQLNLYMTMKIVISLRSEYLYALRPLEERVNHYVTSHFPLDEVRSEAALEIVKSGNGDVDESAISEAAAETIASAWIAAQANRKGAVGLLHLQALLYALHGRDGDQAEGRRAMNGIVSEATVRDLVDEEGLDLERTEDAVALFRRALSLSTTIKIQRCRRAAEMPEIGVDRALVAGAEGALVLMIRHLSSAGYKIMRETQELAELSIGAQLDQLLRGAKSSRGSETEELDRPITDQQFESLFDVIIGSVERGDSEWDLLTSSIVDAARVADEAVLGHGSEQHCAWVDRIHHGSSPLVADGGEVTSGLMLGMAPACVLVEELRRFAFALDWLRSSSIVRISAPGRSRMVVSLIHDRFSDALVDVARLEATQTIREMNALSAQHAIDMWLTDVPGFDPVGPEPGMDEKFRFIVNQRWRGGWVVANFRKVVFVNCDFRGTGFDRCHFEGVTFVNCLLDGAMFSGCTISGSRSDPPQSFEATQTGFILDAPLTAQILNLYRRDLDGIPDILYSSIPGLPALPALRSQVSGVREALLSEGSLTIYGGRISTLAVRNLECEDGAWLSLRHTAGSGLDIVEQQENARLEISGSALRHVGFTSNPLDRSKGGRMEIDVNGSALYQVWVGDDIEGYLDAVDSKLIHVFNGSPGFTATLQSDSSRYHGLVGVDLVADANGIPDPYVPLEVTLSVEEIDPDGKIREECRDMDYRQRPIEQLVEYEKPTEELTP